MHVSVSTYATDSIIGHKENLNKNIILMLGLYESAEEAEVAYIYASLITDKVREEDRRTCMSSMYRMDDLDDVLRGMRIVLQQRRHFRSNPGDHFLRKRWVNQNKKLRLSRLHRQGVP